MIPRSRPLTLLLIFTVLCSLALQIPGSHAVPNYLPGVKTGDSVTYGQFSFNGTSPYPVFPENLSSIKLTIQGVNAQTNNVNASLLYMYKNGTQSTQNLSGNTVNGQGNLFPYLVAGNLTAGDLLFNSPFGFNYAFNETVERVYAGALRSVNLLNLTLTSPGQSSLVQFYWDAQTGFLLDASESVNYSYPAASFSIRFKATDTNVWTPNTSQDYSLDASALSSGVLHRGESTSFRLALASLNAFAGTVNLVLTNPALNNMQPPTVDLNPTNVTLSNGSSASAIVTISANSTTSLGQYVIGVNGTRGPINHQARLLVVVAPPDFIIDANPGNLTISQGATKTSMITVTGRGGFTGTVILQLQTQPPFGTFVTATISPTSLTVNSTMTSATSTLTVSALNSQPGLTSVGINANSGNIYRTLYIPVNVTGPDFRITANPLSLTLKQGQTGQSLITLTSIMGFSGLVSLSTNTYGGISSTLSSTVVNLPAGGQVNTTLTITAFANSVPGVASVYLTGTSSSGPSRSVYISVNVTGPDYRFTSSNSFFSLQPGQNASATITLSSVEGFTGTINLTVSTYGPVEATVNPFVLTLNSTQISATSTLRLTVLPATPSTFAQVDVRATSGNLVHDVFVSISVTGPDFSIVTSPSFLSIPQGGSGQSTVSLSSIDNLSGNVTLAASSFLPTTFSKNPVSLSAGGTATTTLTIQVPLNTDPGYYYVGIEGSSGALVRYSSVQVYVIGPDFSITATPSLLPILQGGSSNSTISITSLDNLSGTVNVSVLTSGPIVVTPLNTTLAVSPNSTITTTLQFSAGPNLAPGYYNAAVTASLGSISHSAYITIQVIGPDFNIFSTPGSLTLERGGTGVATLLLSSLDGFSGNVSLAVSSNGLNATAASTILALSSGGTVSTTITITAPQTALPNTYYYVLAQATSGVIIHTLQINVQVIAPDFSMLSNPAQLFIRAGGSALSTIQLTSLNGFNGTVMLSTFPSIGGNFTSPISAVLSASNVTISPGGSVSVVLNITTTAASAGEVFNVEVTGQSDGLTHFASVFVTVTGPSFMLSPNPGFLTVPQGGSASLNITTTSVNGFSGNVSLSLGLAFGLQGSLSPQNVTLAPGGSVLSVLDVTAPSITQPGFYGILITGTSGAITRNTFIQVQVTGSSFTLTANPFFMVLNPGSSGNSTITLNGSVFSGRISLSTFSFPSGLTTNLNPSSVTLNSTMTSATSTLTITAPTDVAPGIYDVGVSASGNGIVENITIFVKVPGGDFTFFANPGSLSLQQGGSASTTLNVSAVGGFRGLINFTAYALGPGPGLAESFTPFNVTLSMTNPNATVAMTVSARPDSPIGSYAVIVNAISFAGGNLTIHSITLNAAVLPGPDFTIAVTPIFMNIIQGTSGTFTFTLTSQNSFSGNIAMNATFNPPGPTASFPNSTLFLGSGVTVTSTLKFNGNSAVGFYNMTISAAAGGLSHQVIVNVYIAPKPDYSLSANTASLIIVSGSSASSTISVSPVNGFVAPVILSASTPAGFTASFSVNPIPGGAGTTTLTILLASSVTTGNYTVTVTGTSGTLTHSATITVTVAASTKATLVVSQISWTHRLSLSRNANTQTFTLTVKNTGKGPVYIQLLAAGNSTNLATFFTVRSSVVILSPGSSTTISLSQPFNSTSIGMKFNFTIQLFYGTSIDQSGNIISAEVVQAVKGSFTIVQ